MKKINLKISPVKKFHLTEKASNMSGESVYTFEVTKGANKIQIAKEVTALYNVVPLKVNIVNVKPKRVTSRGKIGQTNGIKKAYVFLKKGETINI